MRINTILATHDPSEEADALMEEILSKSLSPKMEPFGLKTYSLELRRSSSSR